MEALTISAANLDIIEQNLGEVAKELNGVVNNVVSTNAQMNDIEDKVSILNDSIEGLIKEIRETTTITDARQSIMYNDSQIEKKYGYYDNIRRSTISLIDAISNSNIPSKSLEELKNKVLLNNPNYWLANSFASLTYWLLNDKENCYKELNNSLRKNEEKTSLFFTLINLKYKRTDTSLRWLAKYLSLQNPTNLDKDFIVILDLVSTGSFGDEAKNLVLNKINNWLIDISSKKEIIDNNIKIWENYIKDNSYNNKVFNNINTYVKENNNIINNISLSNSYLNVTSNIENLLSNKGTTKTIDKILEDLIYEYEEQEQTYKKENLLNSLIISCNGSREKAYEIFIKKSNIYDIDTDLITLFTNIIINKDLFNISNETNKIVLSYVSKYILKAYENLNNQTYKDNYNIKINEYSFISKDGKNIKELNEELNTYLNNKYDDNDKDLLIIMIIMNILGIIGISLTLNKKLLITILIIILIISNIILFNKLTKRTNLRKQVKNKEYKETYSILETTLAELLDYNTIINNNYNDYLKLNTILNTLNVNDYINSNNERNIIIDGK